MEEKENGAAKERITKVVPRVSPKEVSKVSSIWCPIQEKRFTPINGVPTTAIGTRTRTGTTTRKDSIKVKLLAQPSAIVVADMVIWQPIVPRWM